MYVRSGGPVRSTRPTQEQCVRAGWFDHKPFVYSPRDMRSALRPRYVLRLVVLVQDHMLCDE